VPDVYPKVWEPAHIHHYYWDWWYPHYPNVIIEKSKVDQAFKIMKILMDKKLVDKDKLTVGKFIELVNKIAEVL